MKIVTPLPLALALAVTLAGPASAQKKDGSDPRLEDVRRMADVPSARRSLVESRLESAGIEFSRQEYAIPGGHGVNVEVVIGEGDGPAVLLTAHHDVRKGSSGANNNASGVAVLLDVVRRLAADPPPRRVVAVFLDGGEMRLGGSRHWLSERKGERFLGAINFEMCGRGDTVLLGPGEYAAGNALPADAAVAVSALEGAPPVRVLKEVPPTDHRSFLSRGLEACALSMAPADQVEAIERKFATRRGPLPALYRDAFAGLDRAGGIRADALAAAAAAGEAIVRAVAARDDAGNPVVPDLHASQRALEEMLPTASSAELIEAVAALGHRGAIPLLARVCGEQEEATSAAARSLLKRILSGRELREIVAPTAAPDVILTAYRRISRRLVWNSTKGAFELQKSP